MVARAPAFAGPLLDLKITPIGSHNPLRPNEFAVAYMTGLGPVEPAIASGIAPFLLHRAVQPLPCRIDSLGVDVVFAGLAPMTAGVYQVVLRVPPVLPEASQSTLHCDGAEAPIWVLR